MVEVMKRLHRSLFVPKYSVIAVYTKPTSPVFYIGMTFRSSPFVEASPKTAPMFHIMRSKVGHKFKILNSIIGFVMVLVMDYAAYWYRSVHLLPYISMFKNTFSAFKGQTNVTDAHNSAMATRLTLQSIFKGVKA